MVEISGFRWPSTVLQIQIVAAVVAVVTVDAIHEVDHVTVVAVAAEVVVPGPGLAIATVADRGHVLSVVAVDAIDPSPGQTLGPDHRIAVVENVGQGRSRTIERKSSRSLDPDLQSRDRDQNHDPAKKKKVETSRLD